MKLLFVFYVPSGGVETLNRQRCFALQQQGIQCELLYLQDGEGKKNNVNTPIHITNKDFEIKAILERGLFDAVIVCSDHTFLPRLKKIGYSGKIIYEIQGLGTKIEANKWLRNAQNIITLNADALLFPQTSHLKELCIKYFPHTPKFCFHNCFDTENFTYLASQKEESPIIGWVGRLELNKNWRGFIELANLISKQDSSIHFWIFEDATLASPKERREFQLLVASYGLTNKLTIRSNVPHSQMANYYSRIGDSGGFLCSTSKVEGFGYAIVEALSCRCPVLTTDSDGVRSFIMHEQTGLFFNEDQLNKAVNQAFVLMKNKLLRERIRSAGLSYVQEHLSPLVYSTNFVQMMNDLGVQK
ncbi:glycosyltransferase family 4 protein [Bacillus sp. NTK071]|uniref:glycosyltransferase family 4 protein n=1 Tax=Bacillus sp. NTK071 TaxID=2802175 RepID=UPI001A8E2394|nr:glycosyltransferase family 4 protein [Bacillus sp. NTK071]MBN8207257.1 glycosyltransferase family 4 protein [Bacillus sp. NTK071]